MYWSQREGILVKMLGFAVLTNAIYCCIISNVAFSILFFSDFRWSYALLLLVYENTAI